MLGLNSQFKPKFVKNFMAEARGDVMAALKLYVSQVKDRSFPGSEHSFN
jgi:3-methyl-2-oxobutanoate hydroxymethyltransferase